ncbi:MBL fold metallo-hydrolase [Streptomyces sp. NPDC017943]|uniref:MBL fold metallo-hydrolase n=1 Tax=Streptomyces sp. NPDC017943 TaxID=3365019 RepID=UPI0037958BF5
MRADIRQVADGTYLVHGSNTNWIILTEGGEATLIDTGYPGDRSLLLTSLTEVGSAPERVAAVLLTHAHNDHLGSAQYLRTTYGTPVLAHEDEVPHARRDYLHQVSVSTVLRNAWRPGVLPWAVHTLRVGGSAQHPVTAPRPFAQDGPLDLPGRPVPVPTPGHTLGHCAYHLPDVGAVVSGDALVSGHPTSRVTGPQLLPDMFHHERTRAVSSLDLLECLDGDLLLPGHGPAHRGPVARATDQARTRALA